MCILLQLNVHQRKDEFTLMKNRLGKTVNHLKNWRLLAPVGPIVHKTHTRTYETIWADQRKFRSYLTMRSKLASVKDKVKTFEKKINNYNLPYIETIVQVC